MAVEDRRRFDRRTLDGIVGTLRSPRDLRVQDLSLTGMRITTTVEMEAGRNYFVELRHAEREVHVEVNVKWARRDGTDNDGQPLYAAGVAFVEIHRDEAGGIWDWIFPETEP